jgi:hypothetical protein
MNMHETRRWICAATACAAAILLVAPRTAYALSEETRDQDLGKTDTRSALDQLTGPQEVKSYEAIWRQYYEEHPPRPPSKFKSGAVFPNIGQTEIGGEFPVTTFDAGTTEDLSFEFIDASTLLPTTGPEIGSVLYEVNTDAFHPDAFSFTGTSTDASTHFALPYTFGAGDTFVYAVPFDLSGAPIFEADGEGSGNVAIGLAINVTVPEPSTWTMMLVGVGGLGGLMRSQRRRAAV